MIVTPLIGSLIMFWMIDSRGIIGTALQVLLDNPELSLKASTGLTWVTLIIYGIWHAAPFAFIVFYAGLQTVPRETLESAMIDGAKPFQIFRRLTLPMLHKVIAVAVLIRGIDLWRMVDYVFVLTSGGPGTATYTLSLYSWQRFTFVQWGYGATISLFSLIVILIVGNAFIHFAKVKW